MGRGCSVRGGPCGYVFCDSWLGVRVSIANFPLYVLTRDRERGLYLRVLAKARAKARPRRLEKMRVKEIFALLVENGWQP